MVQGNLVLIMLAYFHTHNSHRNSVYLVFIPDQSDNEWLSETSQFKKEDSRVFLIYPNSSYHFLVISYMIIIIKKAK